jgi:hypothetical protein
VRSSARSNRLGESDVRDWKGNTEMYGSVCVVGRGSWWLVEITGRIVALLHATIKPVPPEWS